MTRPDHDAPLLAQHTAKRNAEAYFLYFLEYLFHFRKINVKIPDPQS
jgi:hypothetical protein